MRLHACIHMHGENFNVFCSGQLKQKSSCVSQGAALAHRQSFVQYHESIHWLCPVLLDGWRSQRGYAHAELYVFHMSYRKRMPYLQSAPTSTNILHRKIRPPVVYTARYAP